MRLRLPTPGEVIAIRGGGTYELRNERGKLKAKGKWKNAATTVGANAMLNRMFRGTAQTSSWFMGLINGSTATLAAADTMASHAGWTENVQYSNATRVAWSPGAASGSVLSVAATAFNLNATGTAYGCFCVDDSTKSGTAGTLWSTGAFNAVVSFVNTDTLTITYEVELQAVA